LLTICVCNFWQNNIGSKAAPLMLMKLTTGGNFIIRFQAAFSYKYVFCVAFIYYYSLVFVLFLQKEIGEKVA
jgi:hypothetical protein